MNSWILGIPRVVAISCWSGHRPGGTRIRSVVPGYLWLWLYYYVCTLRCPFGCVLQSRKTVKLGPEYSGFFFGGEVSRSAGPQLQTKQANMFGVRPWTISCARATKRAAEAAAAAAGETFRAVLPEVSAIELFFFFLQLWLWSKTNTRTPSHNRYFWCPRPKNVDY